MSETTTTKAVTPTIMPSNVSAERSLCAQIAATASLRVSMNFTSPHYAFSHEEAQKAQKKKSIIYVTSVPFVALFPAKGVDGVETRRFPGRPESKDDADGR